MIKYAFGYELNIRKKKDEKIRSENNGDLVFFNIIYVYF